MSKNKKREKGLTKEFLNAELVILCVAEDILHGPTPFTPSIHIEHAYRINLRLWI